MVDYGHNFQGFFRVKHIDSSGKEVIHHLPEPISEDEAIKEAYKITIGRPVETAILEIEEGEGRWGEVARWPFLP